MWQNLFQTYQLQRTLMDLKAKQFRDTTLWHNKTKQATLELEKQEQIVLFFFLFLTTIMPPDTKSTHAA